MARSPLSTYRVQLSPDFDLDAAAGIAPYLAALGISHFYASSYLQAAPGSTHGYDVVDHSRVNAELGGEKAHQWFCRSLRENGLGQVLDVVPNHMAISGSDNRWWWDVLENGPSSRYATYFDVDWRAQHEAEGNRILLPILGDHYGRILEAGEIRLERSGGSFLIRYYENVFPAAPRSVVDLLFRAAEASESADLAFISSALDYLPLPTATDRESTRRRHRDKEVIRVQLRRLLDEQPPVRRAVDEEVRRINDDAEVMDELLSAQNYRLARWRIARSDLGYRRFFDINNLVALRIEDDEVFRETHRLILGWLEDGTLDGLRIDHPDGLRDPEQYFRRLREHAPDGWIVAEKILHRGERIPSSWPVAGTTGYDFLTVTDGLFVAAEHEEELTDFYRYFTGEPTDYAEVLREKKFRVMDELLGSDLNRLTELAMGVCERHRRYRDYGREEVWKALAEIVASYPVYRTYVRAGLGEVSEEDRNLIEQVIGEAARRRPELDPELFDFLRQVMLLEYPGDLERELVMRLQQLTGPVMAKGAEDTAFYTYNRFVMLNEVGGDPGHFGTKPAELHEDYRYRAERLPAAMLAGSTHDTKRAEDVRMRLAVLSEIPEVWEQFVQSASVHNEQHRRDGLPDRNTEYLLYQTIVGTWPIEADRVTAYAEKAVREAKTHTSWTAQDENYETALREFVVGIMGDDAFLELVDRLVERIKLPGWINSLSALTLRFTAPGVPDVYQGSELWNFSLVDPDNRRPVDFALRSRLLSEVADLSPEAIMQRVDEGLPKLAVLRAILRLRHERPEAFGAEAGYEPLEVAGDAAAHFFAFLRGGEVATIVPRMPLTLAGAFGDTAVALPAGPWRNVLTGDSLTGKQTTRLGTVLGRFPVAVLMKERETPAAGREKTDARVSEDE
ncbi:MAG: malto-oligosyltrehalose synthase [Spirochaetaceae bacterium]